MFFNIFKLLVVFLPWRLKRYCLVKFFGFKIAKTARIRLAWVYPQYLVMEANAIIDHLNVCINLDTIILKEHSIVGRGNWITGYGTQTGKVHFAHKKDRKSQLYLGEHSAITKNHHIDCTDEVRIGRFSTIAGYSSQILTHSVNILESIQDCKPVIIGDYTFVGTNSVILGGAVLPSNSVLGAKSLLNKAFVEEWFLYGGVPAKELSSINKESKYFYRKSGAID